jgi:mycothiol synthase
MERENVRLLIADPARHFAAIAVLISSQETEPSNQRSLTEWYNKQIDDGILITAAVDVSDQLLGFYAIYRDNLNRERLYAVNLIVDPAHRCLGLGTLLYDNLLVEARKFDARTLKVRLRDTCDEGLRFAMRRGFVETYHTVEMLFDLDKWDESRYTTTIQMLLTQGFRFTNMAELGDTQEARRKLFTLNNGAAATDPAANGIPPWASFEEFEKDVCNSYWYHPDSQIVAVDTHTGEWAAMSAITVFDGADHAYNLFTGTDVRYRGLKLAQAVKSLALRKAREFGVDTVRTSHSAQNAAMIAIDEKLGYVRTPGTLVMEKDLEHG